MMLRYSLRLEAEAEMLEKAVFEALEAGYRTRDITGAGESAVSTTAMGTAINDACRKLAS